MDRLTLVRKLQQIGGGTSLTVIIPADFVKDLGLEKGDYMKMYVANSDRIVMEKVRIPK
jgi:antitoxin component of MazEF toxin-antitoxin module